MPKVTGPLGSLAASGSVASALTFSVRKTGQQVRFQRKQKDAQTAAQLTQRAKYSNAVVGWSDLTSGQREEWGILAGGGRLSGYNLYMKTYLLGEIPALEYSIYGFRYYGSLFYGYES